MSIKSFGPKFCNAPRRVGRRKSYWHPSCWDIGDRALVASYRAKAERKHRANNKPKISL